MSTAFTDYLHGIMVMQDLAEHHWGLSYHGYFSTQTEATGLFIEREHTEEFIPRTRATMMSSKFGLIIAFRGSEPTNLINLRSSGRYVPVGLLRYGV